MKAPRVAFNREALLTFILAHGEKFVLGLVGIAACALAWGGLSAFRTMQPSKEQGPQAIVEQAAETAEHIVAVKKVPEDMLISERGLARTVARWLSPRVESPPSQPPFNKPLFAELSRRGRPDILPIEDLRTVAGVMVLAVKPKAAGDRPGPDRPINLDPAAAPKPAKPARGGRPAPPSPVPPDLGLAPPGADQIAPHGRIVPYVLVTGLIPVAKQRDEFDGRFATASFRDPLHDTPFWSSFRLEKTEVIPGTAEKWTPVDVKAAARRYSAEWAGLQPEPLISPFVLGQAFERRDPAVAPIPFCSPLPQLFDGSWGFNALHPWFTAYLQREAEERKARAAADREKAEANAGVFGGAAETPSPDGIGLPGMPGPAGPGRMPGGPGMMPGGPGMMPGAEGIVAEGVDHRLFRFIDLAVTPGRTYRYRVKTTCWNPNLNVPTRHLDDASLAKQPTLESPFSAATAAVTVPDGIRMLAQPMKKQELKRLKPGTVATMILGRTGEGGFGLRWLLMEVGGLANVDPQVNKRGDMRSRGESLVTDRVLLDMRGRLEDRAETRAGKPTPPPEPLEMIFLRPDGTFEVASSAESQMDIDRYLATLQPDDAAAAAGERVAQPPAPADSPFGNPFAPKK